MDRIDVPESGEPFSISKWGKPVTDAANQLQNLRGSIKSGPGGISVTQKPRGGPAIEEYTDVVCVVRKDDTHTYKVGEYAFIEKFASKYDVGNSAEGEFDPGTDGDSVVAIINSYDITNPISEGMVKIGIITEEAGAGDTKEAGSYGRIAISGNVFAIIRGGGRSGGNIIPPLSLRVGGIEENSSVKALVSNPKFGNPKTDSVNVFKILWMESNTTSFNAYYWGLVQIPLTMDIPPYTIPFKNNSGEIIPASSMTLMDGFDSLGLMQMKKPDEDSANSAKVFFTWPIDIPIGAYGYAATGDDGPIWAKYSSSPSIDDQVGTASGSFEANKDQTGFLVLENDSTRGTTFFRPFKGGVGLTFEQLGVIPTPIISGSDLSAPWYTLEKTYTLTKGEHILGFHTQSEIGNPNEHEFDFSVTVDDHSHLRLYLDLALSDETVISEIQILETDYNLASTTQTSRNRLMPWLDEFSYGGEDDKEIAKVRFRIQNSVGTTSAWSFFIGSPFVPGFEVAIKPGVITDYITFE